MSPPPEDRVSIWETGTLPSQKCGARKGDTGEPCKAWAITGGSVCVYHGGKAPQIRAAARRRVEALVPLAFDTLEDVAENSDNAAARVRAAAEILKAAGIAAPTERDEVLAKANPDLDALITRALASRFPDPG